MRPILTTLAVATAMAISFASPSFAEESCTLMLRDLSFCPAENWVEDTEKHPYGIAVWRKGSVTAKMIAQSLTKGLKVDTDMVFASIKESVRASQDDPDSVIFHHHDAAKGDLIDHGILSYDLVMEGQTLRMHHSFMLSAGTIIQFVSHSKQADAQQNLKDHISFVSSFRLVDPQIAA